jgi:predicted  nucleic acid-binding Zn-ribbon protein
MKDRILKELERLQGELRKGQEQREALVDKLRKTETQLVYIQGAIHAMKLLMEDETPKESEDASE